MQNVKTGMTVTFPESLLAASREDSAQFRLRVLLQTLGSLYVEGKISGGTAAKVLGCTKDEFYRLISERGFPVITYDESDAAYEAATSRNLAKQIQER